MDDFSILIPDGESGFALHVMQCFSQIPGLKVYALSRDRWALARFSRYKTKFIYLHNSDSDADWISALAHAVQKYDIDIVFPVDQDAIRMLSVDGESLAGKTKAIPLPTPGSFDIAADKWLMAKFLMVHDLPTPGTILCENDTQFEENLSRLKFPVLTKPRVSTGGKGINYWGNSGKLQEHLSSYKPPEEKIVQSFVRGFEIDCSVLCLDGEILAYTIQKGILPGSLPFAPPRGVRFVYNNEVYGLVEKLMGALKWSGLAHIDLMYDEEDAQYKIIEINPRSWGTMIGSLQAGVNFPYLACLVGLKTEFSQPNYRSKDFYYLSAILGLLRNGKLRKRDLNISNTNIKHSLLDPMVMVGRVLRKFTRK